MDGETVSDGVYRDCLSGRAGRSPRNGPKHRATHRSAGPVSQGHQPFSDLTLAITPNAVSWARRHTVDVLQRWRLTSDTIETVRLLVSELTTNAIRHARPGATTAIPSHTPSGTGTISFRLHLTSSSVFVFVTDGAPRPPMRRKANSSATGGRGLLLTEIMASRWGYYPSQTRGGKVVWAEVPTQPSAASGARDSASRPHGLEVSPVLLRQVLTGLDEL
ncbi:ATP-binding protein [Streptomyces sp. XD-27]|uniref:ATP-binding protein n=1 Tax=Streptomyces sp. XD-27 TaxID=3062779 RepID=UPI0026F477EF|nr:ATP-binding protein [Streptomyces sp. XD-27]WKX74311.1 ATP-binding protein [Streptomyces sp. XD-27]